MLEIRHSMPDYFRNLNLELRNAVIKQALETTLNHESLISGSFLNLIEKINKFNLDTRNFKRDRSKKSRNESNLIFSSPNEV